ncbi:extracellular solute-binding protein [Streptomyces hyaluromycini]|uniref:Extracellular solute-binding protein n=1 Tax=Streptomyces hyaluromycini TaxID=1377993 RepID=A0ABV1X8D1_9ACTN
MPGHRTTGFCASALALALCAVLAGCGGSGESAGGGKVVLRYTWWGNPDRAARTDQAVALFEKQHPDIQVRTSFSDYNAYKQKLAVQATGGDAPDVMQLDYRQIDQYASGGVLLDLARQKAVLHTSEIDPGWTWNDFFTQLIYLFDPDKFTLTLALSSFVDSFSQSAFGPMFAMSVIALLPIVLFFLAFQRFLVEGMASSGVKG